MKPEKNIFRAEISTIYVPIIQFSIISSIIYIFLFFLTKDDFRFQFITIKEIFIFESVLILFALITFLFFIFSNRIIVNESGISTITPYSNIPKREFIYWESVGKILHKNVLGYKYYLLCSTDGEREVWVPKRIKDRTKFYYAVRSFAGNSNLFTLELMKS